MSVVIDSTIFFIVTVNLFVKRIAPSVYPLMTENRKRWSRISRFRGRSALTCYIYPCLMPVSHLPWHVTLSSPGHQLRNQRSRAASGQSAQHGSAVNGEARHRAEPDPHGGPRVQHGLYLFHAGNTGVGHLRWVRSTNRRFRVQ